MISTIIYLIISYNSILDNKIVLRSFLSLRIIIFKNKDLRDNEDLDIKVIKFI